MADFYSVYAPFLKEYIEFKRNLGYEMKYIGNFKLFDRFIGDNNILHIDLTREESERWCTKRPNEKETTCYHRINDLRNFCIFMNSCGYTTYIPMSKIKYRTDFTPHIFTKDELARFFQSCDHLTLTGYSNTTYVYPALFRLLLGCGLRISEALSLKIQDVDFTMGTIILHETKNGEERILPFTNSLKSVLLLYVSKHKVNAQNIDYFFSKKDGTKICSDTAYSWFRKVLKQAGIPHGGRGKGPRVHDFRHTFCVRSLAAMDDAELDLYYALPILSKYLGHKSLEATDKYVRLTAEMYPGIMDKMNQLCAYVFPEVISHETY